MGGLSEIKIEAKAVAIVWASNLAIHENFPDIVIEGDA